MIAPLYIVIDWFLMSINIVIVLLVAAVVLAALGKRRGAIVAGGLSAVVFFGVLLHHWDIIGSDATASDGSAQVSYLSRANGAAA